jgi:hypothetical protein
MRKLHAAALALSVAAACPAAAGIPSRDVSKTLPLAAGESVRVETYKGSVKVTTWDRAEVAVQARVEADDSCGTTKDLAHWVDETRIVIEKRAGGVTVQSSYDALEGALGWFGRCTARPFVRYTIRMPKNAELRIKDYKSDLVVKGLEAELSIDTYKGSVAIEGHAGALSVDTYKGEVDAGLVRLAGDVHAETYKGSVVLHLPGSAGFELSANTGRRGSLRSDFQTEDAGRAARWGSRRVSVAVNGGGPRVSLRTDKGRLAVRRG